MMSSKTARNRGSYYKNTYGGNNYPPTVKYVCGPNEQQCSEVKDNLIFSSLEDCKNKCKSSYSCQDQGCVHRTLLDPDWNPNATNKDAVCDKCKFKCDYDSLTCHVDETGTHTNIYGCNNYCGYFYYEHDYGDHKCAFIPRNTDPNPAFLSNDECTTYISNNPKMSQHIVDSNWIKVNQNNLNNCSKVSDCTKYNNNLYSAMEINLNTPSSDVGLFCWGDDYNPSTPRSCRIYANGNKYEITDNDSSSIVNKK